MRINAMGKRSVAAVAVFTVLIGLLTATPALATYSASIRFPNGATTFFSPFPGFNMATELDPRLAVAQSNLGVALDARGDAGLAEQRYRRALELDRDAPRAVRGTL